jgi:hypothetical protein
LSQSGGSKNEEDRKGKGFSHVCLRISL